MEPKVHHLSCGTDCPFGGWLMDGRSRGPLARLVCHCLLIETNAGLVLVDTGYGLRDVHEPFPRLSRPLAGLLNIKLRESETAVRQVAALGFSPDDVRHIVITHLDFDHAGGLEDFPNAAVHVMAAELEAARSPKSLIAQSRYRRRQYDEVADWRLYQPGGETWLGFRAVRDLSGLPPEILLVPLVGHTWGHAGVAVQQDGGWLLHAGDAYFHRDEMQGPKRRCPPGLRLYQSMMEVDRRSRLENQRRLRELSLDPAACVKIFSAHDAAELAERQQSAPRPGHAEAGPALSPG